MASRIPRLARLPREGWTDASLCQRRRAEERRHERCPVAKCENVTFLGESKSIQATHRHRRTFSCSQRLCLLSVSEGHQVTSVMRSIPVSKMHTTR